MAGRNKEPGHASPESMARSCSLLIWARKRTVAAKAGITPQCDVGTRSNGRRARCGSRELGGMPAESRGGACIRWPSICVPGQPPLVVVNQKNIVVSAGGDWPRASFPELAMRGSGMA